MRKRHYQDFIDIQFVTFAIYLWFPIEKKNCYEKHLFRYALLLVIDVLWNDEIVNVETELLVSRNAMKKSGP